MTLPFTQKPRTLCVALTPQLLYTWILGNILLSGMVGGVDPDNGCDVEWALIPSSPSWKHLIRRSAERYNSRNTDIMETRSKKVKFATTNCWVSTLDSEIFKGSDCL
jgi:hypothetical protein